MPKQIDQTELDEIVHIVAKFPDGVALKKITESLSISISLQGIYSDD